MELEFDNEIDALLREEGGARTITISEVASSLHLDADEISAFAENAVPKATKQNYAAHFADCEGCRKTLSNVILLNSEAVTETASAVSAPALAENIVPWYRKLFLFPNLAYMLGSLVLLFGGFLAISVLRNSGGNAVSDVSQISSKPVASGPNLSYGDTYSNSNASSAANSMNTAANAMVNSANSEANTANAPKPVFAANAAPTVADSKSSAGFTTDGITSGADAPAAAQPPPPKDQPVVKAAKDDLAKIEEQRKAPPKENEKSMQELKLRSVSPDGPLKKKLPGRSESSDMTMRENDIRANKAAVPNASALSGRRQVGGKTFEYRLGVWYDSAYSGHGTTNVRRGTDAYKKLDSGLRSVADSIPGTVVIVWKEKAFRID